MSQTEALHTLPAQIDGLDIRADGMMVAATSRVFGNEWDGGVTAYTTDQQQKSCHLPSGCTSISFVGASSEAVALSCDDGNVVVLSLSSLGEEGWRPLQMFADHENMVSAVRSCPVDANILVSGSVDQTVKVWSLSGDEGDCLTTLRGHCAPVWDVAYSPVQRNTVASVGQDGRLFMWDDRTSKSTSSTEQGAPLFCMCWNGEKVYAGSENGEIFLFDPRVLQGPVENLKGHMDAVRCLVVVIGTDGTTKLVSAGDDCEICVRDFSNLKNDAKSTARHKDFVRALCAVPGGGAVYSGSWDNSIARVTI